MFGRSVDVFITDLKSVVIDEALLSVAELGHALALASSPEFNEYLAARTWLRRRLAEYLDCPAGEILFDSDTDEKPVVALPTTDLTFDLGFTDRAAVLAVGFRRDVGVAIERLSGSLPQPEDVAHTLTVAERDRYDRALEPERSYRQFCVRKTALQRASGKDTPWGAVDTTGLSPVNRDGFDITDLSLGGDLLASVAARQGSDISLTLDDTLAAPERQPVWQRIDAMIGVSV